MNVALARPFLFALLIFAFAPGAAISQTVLHVMKQNPTPGDGSSWASAYKHPNDALAAAESMAGPVEVWVTTATYVAARSGTDRSLSYVLRGELELLGGFDGTESSKTERDPVAHPTILSGDVGLDFNPINDAYHVVRAENLSGPVVVDGFHIIRGNASQTEGDGLGGGGLLVRNADVTLRRCVLQWHWAGAPFPDFGDRGGAVHIEESGSLAVENCQFLDNEAYFGAGIDVSTESGDVDISILDSSFERNRALEGLGAGINFSRGSLTVEGTSFEANRARLAVAIQATLAREVVLRDCRFERNRGTQKATVELDRADDEGATPATIERCQFLENTATSAFGTALNAGGTLVEVSECEFRRNTNVGFSSVSGDFLGLGTVAVVGRIGHRFSNCLFADNFAGHTGGLILRSAPTSVVNTTFANNHAASADSFGAGLATMVDGDLEVKNVILWGNRYGTGEEDDQPGTGGASAQLTVAPTSTLVLGHSDIEGWTSGAADETFDADPLFVNPALEDYRLLAGSPAIDAGDNAAAQGLTTDLEGQPRIMDGRLNGGMRVDLGPYEFLGAVVAAPPALASGLALRVSESHDLVRIEYRLLRASSVRMDIFDLRGRRVRQLLDTAKDGGHHQVLWDRRDHAGRSIAAGVYLVRLRAGRESASGKVLVSR